MSVIYILIPLAIILVVLAIGVFFWAVKSNQFDDLERHGHSILFDDDLEKRHSETPAPATDKPTKQAAHTAAEQDDH